jgi:dihydroorotate dehydrogenase electron transfer subunit
MKQFDARVVENREIAPDYFEIFFEWPSFVRTPFPGQILSINVEKGFHPFLRRPFAFASFDKAERLASVIYHRRGPATQILAALRPGDLIDVLGPRGFYFQLGTQSRPILVGGGVGTGPVVFAANWLAGKGLSPQLVLGFRHQGLFPSLSLRDEVNLQVCTDDGSLGFSGNVVDFLNTKSKSELEDSFVWACGPYPMLKALHNWSSEKQIPCKVSVEEVMACGVGACMGCAVETTDARKVVRVCTEGPVFDSEVLKWT